MMRLTMLFLVSVFVAGAPAYALDEQVPFQMRKLYHEFDMSYQRARRTYGVSLDLTPAYEACIGRGADLERCQRSIELLDERLHTRIQDAQMLAENKRQTEILREQAKRSPEINSNTTITIYEDNPYYHHRKEPWRDRPPFFEPDPHAVPTYRPRPGFTPQNKYQAGEGFRD